MWITIRAIELCIDILDCMKTEEIRLATLDHEHLKCSVSVYFTAGHQQRLRYRRHCSHTGLFRYETMSHGIPGRPWKSVGLTSSQLIEINIFVL